MITEADETLLRRALAIAAHAVTLGDAPYGSLLAGPDGEILAEAHNTVRRDNDITAHPELKLARWAARELDPATAAGTTLYTSCQPCGMCHGGIVRSGLGRVVHALSTEQLVALNPQSGAWPVVPQDGPALPEEARAPIEAYYRPPGPPGPDRGAPGRPRRPFSS
ncbi:nucleoside deaminase [Kitasatospora sp. NPDC059577]|uniref:nucleoside deaminase n=1 Tax=unclassified Kitasatospora TaxID=2633591 RepID=UPI003683ADEF